MRGAFARELTALAHQDERIMLLTGDLGYMALEPFSDAFPNRFLNVGVAEQNMIGLATGLAEAGFIPFCYSIATFAALRPYEFIRNGPIQHRLPVRIVGVGGGVEYGQNGLSHYGLEDAGVMRLQPGITTIAPADHEQTAAALHATWNLPGPIYYRLGKDDRTVVPGLNGRFELGRIQTLGGTLEGDVLLVSLGNMGSEVAVAAEELKASGVRTEVAIVSSFNPSPNDDLARLMARFPVAVSVEAHYVTGGAGSLVAEIIAENNLPCRLARCGFHTMPDGRCGSQKYLHHKHGLSSAAIVETALQALEAALGRTALPYRQHAQPILAEARA